MSTPSHTESVALLQQQVTNQQATIASLSSKVEACSTAIAETRGASSQVGKFMPLISLALVAGVGTILYGGQRETAAKASANQLSIATLTQKIENQSNDPDELIKLKEQVLSLKDAVAGNSSKLSGLSEAQSAVTRERAATLAEHESRIEQNALRTTQLAESLRANDVTTMDQGQDIAEQRAKLGASVAEIEAQLRGLNALQNSTNAWIERMLQIVANNRDVKLPDGFIPQSTEIPAKAEVKLGD
jgi:chromosome segregation ATPase